MSTVDVDDLALLAAGFEAAMLRSTDPAAATLALFDLGWGEVLAAAPARGIATAFTALGTTGSAAAILDDVLAHGLGLEPSPETAVVLPGPSSWAPPARRHGGTVTVAGIATGRLEHAATALVVLGEGSGSQVLTVDAGILRPDAPRGLDPDHAIGRVRADLAAGAITPVEAPGTWAGAVALGRTALAHQLVGGARTMLEQARQHAVDRVQFGRAVASFQAVRHRLADALVAIEAAAAVAGAIDDDADPLAAAVAKSLAGIAARTTATHAQQVLAGIGFTADHPFHRWMKRALVLDLVLGSSVSLPAEIGGELLRRGEAPRLVELHGLERPG